MFFIFYLDIKYLLKKLIKFKKTFLICLNDDKFIFFDFFFKKIFYKIFDFFCNKIKSDLKKI
jgi:hypothetical protein